MHRLGFMDYRRTVIALVLVVIPVYSHATQPVFSEKSACGIIANGFFKDFLQFPAMNCAQSIHFQTRFTFDNDTLYPPRNMDGQYTQGFRYESAHMAINSLSWETNTFGWAFGQEIYTPTILTEKAVQTNDRPYAGLLYIGLFSETVDSHERLTKIGFDLAILGKYAFAKVTQSGWHTVTRTSEIPLGWDNQVGTELGFIYRVAHIPFVASPNDRWIDWAPKLKANLGNIFLDFSIESITRLRILSLNPYHDKTGKESFFFNRAELKLVGYNALLQGGLFENATKYKESVYTREDIYRLVTDVEWGVAFHLGRYSVGYSVVFRSSEIKEVSWQPDFHAFGRLTIKTNL